MFQNVGGAAYKEGLGTTEALDAHFGFPHRCYRTIHIAGTNGKGSVSHTLAAILQSAGYRTGLFTSPHLTDFRERIRVDGVMISKRAVSDFVENQRCFFEPLCPSFFELTTAMAFRYFAKRRVDVAVVEVGMGGRLDCTNVISPEVSVITNISLDHTKFLGSTLESIAREKAGIIKYRVPVVVGETQEETCSVFMRAAEEKEAPICFADAEGEIKNFDEREGKMFYRTRSFGLVEGCLCGEWQVRNAATVLSTVRALRSCGFNISDESVREGFLHVCELTGLRGRWQYVSVKPLIICDTGHNVGGLAYISRRLKSFIGVRLHIIFGMAPDKDVEGVLGLLPSSAEFYFVRAKSGRGLDAEELCARASGLSLKGKSFADVASAFCAARMNAGESDLIFIGGSNFVVADFLSFYKVQ